MSYAERLRHSLAESRARGMQFAPAWARALRNTPMTDDIDWTDDMVEFARAAFAKGYFGFDVLGSLSIITEGDDFATHRLTDMAYGGRVA